MMQAIQRTADGRLTDRQLIAGVGQVSDVVDGGKHFLLDFINFRVELKWNKDWRRDTTASVANPKRG